MSGVDVLIVEDDPDDIARMAEVLGALGRSWHSARTVQDAISFLNSTPCERIILDVIIGGNQHGALLVLESLRARASVAKVLILSAAGGAAPVVRLKEGYPGLVWEVMDKANLYELLPTVSRFLTNSSVSSSPTIASGGSPTGAGLEREGDGTTATVRVALALGILFAAAVLYLVGAWGRESYPSSQLGYLVLEVVSLVGVVGALGVAVGPENLRQALRWVGRPWNRTRKR